PWSSPVSLGDRGRPYIRLLGHNRPAARAVCPGGGERSLALPADSFPGRRRHTVPTRRAHARLLRLALVDALLELLETRAQRASELREFVRTEQDQHDDQNDEQFLSPESKHCGNSSA